MNKTRPILRGWFHQSAFFMALGATFAIILKYESDPSFYTKILFCFTLCNLFLISAIYHRVTWKNQSIREIMRKLDHSSIFLLIAGTATPVAYIGLNSNSFFNFMLIIWGACLLGIAQVLFLQRKNKFLAAIVYIATGSLALLYVPELYQQLGATKTALIVWGGVLYIIGAIIYGLKKPNPLPRYFGHHEIFHILVVFAAFIHYAVIY